MRYLIAFAGKRHSGKSTAVNIIARLLNEARISNFITALAEPIKLIGSMIAMDNINNWFDDSGKLEYVKTLNMTRREFLTRFGTDFMHEHNKNIWLEHLLNRINALKAKVIIIEDLRMIHEYKYIKNINAHTNQQFKVLIIKMEGNPAGFEDVNSTHASETEVDSLNADYTINTDITDRPSMIYKLKELLTIEEIL